MLQMELSTSRMAVLFRELPCDLSFWLPIIDIRCSIAPDGSLVVNELVTLGNNEL